MLRLGCIFASPTLTSDTPGSGFSQMKLLIVTHKLCWPSKLSASGYATDGGFPFQIAALSELFDETRLCVPCGTPAQSNGEISLAGHNLRVVPLPVPNGSGIWRKLRFSEWFVKSVGLLLKEVRRADAVHAPIPGDVGTIGMLLAWVMRKPLFVRHCGNWFIPTTAAEYFWKWFMETFAGGRNVMLATGGAKESPSRRNPNLHWIFSTSLTERELNEAGKGKTPNRQARLIIICRQEQKKGTGIVIESLPLILQKFPMIKLDVVGDGSDLPKFKELTARLNLSEHVTFYGKLDQTGVRQLLKQADVFCYPSTSSEGFPKVVLEALAYGLPVITTKVSVLPLLLARGGGRLIDIPAPNIVAQNVIELLSDSNAYLEMSAQAIDIARQYSLERWRNTIRDLLHGAWGSPLRADV